MKRCTVPFFIAHRGCPHKCVFCDQVKISGSSGQLPGETDVAGKIAQYRETAGRGSLEVAFFGGSFTSLPQEVQEQLLSPLQPLMESGEVGAVRISTRPDSVDSVSAAFLKKMGVATVEVGVQSMDDDVLELSGRGYESRQVVQAVHCLKNEGLAVGAQLMPGLPGDSPAKSLDSLGSVLDMKPDFLRIYPTVVISGTLLEELYRCGSYGPMTLDGAVRLCKIMLHKCLLSDVPVIRMGLQPTNELLTDGVIVAGPYHSAFRQLIESELCFDLMAGMIGTAAPADGTTTVFCSPSRISDVIGQKKANVERLWQQFGVRLAAVRPDPLMSPQELTMVSGGRSRTGNMLHDIQYGREVVENE